MNKEILRLAIPNIISNISVPLLSTVDTIIMGQLSLKHIGAVGVASMIYNFIYWNFGFLRMGTTGITAQAYGQSNKEEISLTLARSFFVALIIATILILLAYPIKLLAFKGMNVLSDQAVLVEQYYYIRLIAAPAALSLLAFNGWFFGMQNAWIPLILVVCANVLNIIVSYIAVFHYDMGIAGVAWGTVVGQYFGFGLALFFLAYYYRSYLSGFRRKLIFQWDNFKRFFEVNLDIFIRTIFLTLAFAFFFSQSSSGGELILAVNVILLQLINWMSYGIDGFAYAAESLVGKYKGAQNDSLLSKTIKYSMIWGAVFALLYALVYLFAYDFIIASFSDEDAILEAAKDLKLWMIIFPVAAFVCYIWDGIFVGLTASKAMRNSCFIAFILYLMSYYAFKASFDQHAIWLALFVFLIARGGLQSYLYSTRGKNLI